MSLEPNPRYNVRAAFILGLLQWVMGLLLFILQVPFYTYDLTAGFGHVGIWTGIVFMICGILALISWKQNSSCMIVAVMAVSIVTSLVAFSGIVAGSITLIVGSFTSVARYEGDEHYKYKLQEGLAVTQFVICLVEVIVSLVMSGFCCAAVCCGAKQNKQSGTLTVMTVPGSDPPAVILVPEDTKPAM